MKTFFCILFAFICQILLFAQPNGHIFIRKAPSLKQLKDSLKRGGNVSNLYENCPNVVHIDAKWKGSFQKALRVELSNGKVIPDSFDNHKFILIPTHYQSQLKVYTGDSLIGQLECPLEDIPAPNVKVWVNKAEYEIDMVVPKTTIVTIKMEALKDFKEMVPDESDYYYPEIYIVELTKNQTIIKKTHTFDKPQQKYVFSLPEECLEKAGTKILIAANTTNRINKQGQEVISNLCHGGMLYLSFITK